MKVLLILGLIAVMATIVLSRNADWGERARGDEILLNRTIIAQPEYGRYQDRVIGYDPWLDRKEVTAIYVKDNFRNSSGAEAHLIDGGSGKKYAIIRLHGEYSQGFNSTILIYGK